MVKRKIFWLENGSKDKRTGWHCASPARPSFAQATGGSQQLAVVIA
jgi:hypothetical protein